jgi:hypothetical protein
MSNTEKSVGLLKAIALIAGLAILLWSLGLPSLKFANAASLQLISDTITDSAPSAVADHTIEFTHPAAGVGVPNGEDIVITFPSGFNLTGIGTEDISLFVDSTDFGQANWSLVNGGQTLTITIDTGSIAAGASTSIIIGDGASIDGGTPDTQITNPGPEGSYEIDITAGNGPSDSGSTRVVILTSVEVTASVDTIFTFAVAGVNSGISVNGETTTGDTSSTSIPFGALVGGSATTSAQQLTVNTNASNGYSVTVQTDGDLQSTTGGVIDGFVDGSETNAPTTWAAPGGDVSLANEWGHWGVTTDDATTTTRSGDEFGPNEFIAASTSPRVIMEHNGPANGTGTGIGTTYVAYKVEITNLQEAGDDYSTNLTYIATPTF